MTNALRLVSPSSLIGLHLLGTGLHTVSRLWSARCWRVTRPPRRGPAREHTTKSWVGRFSPAAHRDPHM